MLTNDKEITTPEYWDRIYTGNNHNAKQDASNLVRPANAFDRFDWVAGYADGPTVLGIASGHAHVEKRLAAAHPEWMIFASDQAKAADKAANYPKYFIFSAYEIPFETKLFTTVICCQAMEYMEDQESFLKEAKRVANFLLITVPIGEMKLWSQLRIYTEENVRELLTVYGTIKVFERQGDLLLVKLEFYEYC